MRFLRVVLDRMQLNRRRRFACTTSQLNRPTGARIAHREIDQCDRSRITFCRAHPDVWQVVSNLAESAPNSSGTAAFFRNGSSMVKTAPTSVESAPKLFEASPKLVETTPNLVEPTSTWVEHAPDSVETTVIWSNPPGFGRHHARLGLNHGRPHIRRTERSEAHGTAARSERAG